MCLCKATASARIETYFAKILENNLEKPQELRDREVWDRGAPQNKLNSLEII